MKQDFICIKKKEKGQGMVEFALVFPFLLGIFVLIINAGHFVYVQNSVEIASRVAARYGAGMGNNVSGIPLFQDCVGIKNAAKGLAPLAFVSDTDVEIEYDQGPGTDPSGACPAPAINLGDRIKVTVTGHYDMLIEFINLPTLDMVSTSYYTVMTHISVK